MIIELAPDALHRLYVLAEAEVRRHAPRTPERRAASHLWASIATSPTIDGARRAVASFGDKRTQSDASALLHRLAARLAATATTEG